MKTVEIVRISTGEVEHRIQCVHSAPDRVEKGVNINLNHEEFFTRIVDVGPEGRGNESR